MNRHVASRYVPAILVLFLFCGMADEARCQTTFTSFITGGQEVPPVPSRAFSIAVFTFMANDNLLVGYRLNFRHNQIVKNVHIHEAPAGEDGPIILNLRLEADPGVGICVDLLGGLLTFYILTADQLTGDLAGQTLSDLKAVMQLGGTYINLHTDAEPGGWIRGQMTPAAPY